MRLFQHLTTTNDTNGNPRRIWAIYNTAPTEPGTRDVGVTYIDEGYSGRDPVKGIQHELPPVEITPAEYRALKKLSR